MAYSDCLHARAAGGGVHGVDALVWEVTRDWVRDGIGAPTLMGD